jgi:hypothetical protein
LNGLLLNAFKPPSQVFQEEGVLFYPQLFSGQQLERLRAACEDVLQQFHRDNDVNDPDIKNKIGASMSHLDNPRWHRRGKENWKTILETVADPRCLGPVEQILEGPSQFLSTQLFFNPRFASIEGNWHRDIQGLLPDEDAVRNHIASAEPEGMQFQIALVNNDDVEYVPFSATRYDSPEEYTIRCADNRAHSREAGMPNAMRLCLRAGDAVIFHPNGLHRGRYLQNNPRRTLMISYTPRGRVLDMPLSRHPWMLEPGYFEGLSKRATAYFQDFADAYRECWQNEQHKASIV